MTEKISLAMIVRDDEHTLEECLKSARPYVDEIVIADTGSTDGSMEIARKYADRVELFLGANSESGLIEDFAMARNFSFSLASGADWILWLDGDDVLRGGEHIRALIESAPAGPCRFLWKYEYARDGAGNVTCIQIRERLMRPAHAQTWKSPVHEYAISNEPGNVDIPVEEVVVEHRSDVAARAGKVREQGRNLRILESYVRRVGEQDVRALYYTGVEYQAAGNTAQALRYLRRYIELSDWADEKCRAMLNMAEYYLHGGDYQSAIEWAQKAMLTKSWPEPWFILGRAFYAMAHNLKQEQHYNYRRAIWAFTIGLDHPTDILLFANPMERYAVHQFLNVCYNAIGLQDKALWSCEEGLKGIPDHPLMLQNRAEYLRRRRRSSVLVAIDELEREADIGAPEAAIMREVMKGSIKVERTPEPTEPPRTIEAQPVEPGKLDLVFFLGPALERWTPETWSKTGMGGSETMALHMARRLRKLGHRVRFYADCTSQQEGVYDGVEWLQWERFRGVQCDVLIASRFPWAVDDEVTVSAGTGQATIGGCKATARALWVHDVTASGPDLDLRRALRYDRILCLSEWHKATFIQAYTPFGTVCPFAEKVHITRNGIDPARFDGEEERNPHRAVYSSSPDRGLPALLAMWPKIREQVTDAELVVAYGFENWEKSTSDPAQQAAIAHLKQLLKSTPGVTMRGRLEQKELAREFMRAGVWAYPTWWIETSCITAMEAQAAGLHIVTSALAALNETVGDRGVLLDWTSDTRDPTPEYQERFIEETVKAMRRAELGPNLAGIDYARAHFGLDELAADWSEMLEALHAELSENPVPAFEVKGAAE